MQKMVSENLCCIPPSRNFYLRPLRRTPLYLQYSHNICRVRIIIYIPQTFGNIVRGLAWAGLGATTTRSSTLWTRGYKALTNKLLAIQWGTIQPIYNLSFTDSSNCANNAQFSLSLFSPGGTRQRCFIRAYWAMTHVIML